MEGCVWGKVKYYVEEGVNDGGRVEGEGREVMRKGKEVFGRKR